MGSACVDGYARGNCHAFPSAESAPDAIEVTAGLETTDTVVIRYSIERNYLPVAVGENVFVWPTRKWRHAIADEMIAAHMDAYLAQFEILKNGAKE